MEKNEEFDSDFSKEDVPISKGFWNYMENYWHNNREFPESTESSLNKKADLVHGKVPASQLPSYVDDVLEFDSFKNLPNPGEKGKIYLVTNDNSQFRWSDSGYIQLNSDEFLMTTNTHQAITGRKEFITLGGNDSINNSLFVTSNDGNYPAISFYRPGVDLGQLKYLDSSQGFYFVNSPNSSTIPVNALEFRKSGSDNDYVLLGGGADKPVSDFALANDLNFVHKIDTTYGLNNASDTHTNKSWFDYNWAGQGHLGSVLNVSGFGGTDQRYNTEIFAAYNSDYAAIRSKNGDNNTWNDPMVLWHNKNFDPEDLKNIGARNLILNSKNFGFYASDATNSNNSVLGEVTVTGSGFWNAYGYASLTDYTPDSKLLYQVEIRHDNSTPIDMTFYLYNNGDDQVFNQTILPNVWTKVTRVSSPNHTTSVLMGIGASNTDIGTKVEYRNKQVEEGKVASTYRPAYEDFVLPTQLNDYWKKESTAGYLGIKTDNPFSILTPGGYAQKIYAGGLLVSDAYQEENLIPNYGAYIKGHVKTLGQFIGDYFNSSALPGGQIINASSGALTLGNPTVPQLNIETGNSNLVHYRAGYGVGVIWDQHNFNPDAKISITDADNKYISKTVVLVDNFNTIDANSGGIYRGQGANTGVKYLYAPMLHMGGQDTISQLQVQYANGTNDGELSYRGGFNGGWSGWRTAWDNVNLPNPVNQSQLGNYLPLTGGTITDYLKISKPNGSDTNGIAHLALLAPNLDQTSLSFFMPSSNVAQMLIGNSNNWGTIAMQPYGGNVTINGNNVATQTWVNSQNYLTSSSLNSYATESWVSANFPNQTLSIGDESNTGQTLTLSNGNSVQITNNFVGCRDGSRNPNDIKPNTSGNRVRFDFAHASLVKGSGNYAGVMTYAPWDGTTASTGDSSYQLAFANQTGINGEGIPMLKLRKGIDEKWSSDWYKMWSEGDFSQSDIDNWNHIANTAATQSWVQSQNYAPYDFVEAKIDELKGEIVDPAPAFAIKNEFTTVILTDNHSGNPLELEGELIPESFISIINLSKNTVDLNRDGKTIDRIYEHETSEYYITKEGRLIKKGTYKSAQVLI